MCIDSLTVRWTFGAHEPYGMYRRVGRHCTGGIDGNAEWVKPWLDWWDAESPKLMKDLGLNALHSRFYKGMGWAFEQKDFPNVKKFVGNCHSNGVMALAYVQFATLYPEIMRTEIPDVDAWQQLDVNGKPALYNGQYFRSLPCLCCSDWEAYVKRMCTIALVEGGFDGIMFDNLWNGPCYCERCQREFSKYLATLPDKERRFGFSDLSNVPLPRAAEAEYVSREVRDPVVQAWILWRAKQTTDVLCRLREHIKSVRSDALVAANPQPLRRDDAAALFGLDPVEVTKTLDILIGQTGTYPSFSGGALSCRIRELKLARELKTPIVALCDADSKLTPEQEVHYLLPLYEDLVFGGVPTDRTVISPKAVPGFVDRTRVEKRKTLLKSFDAFVRENRRFFEAPVYAPVRLFYPSREIQFSKAAASGLAAAEEILIRCQIPWSYLVSRPGRPLEVPAGAEVVVVANQLALSVEQVEALVDYASRGGKLVVTGDSGRYNEWNGQRLTNPLVERVRGLPGVAIRETADLVSPCELGWTYRIGAPEDRGEALLADLKRTGFRLPFEITGCPESVTMDVRQMAGGYVFHFVNYDPGHPVENASVRMSDGNVRKVPVIVEYSLVK